MTSHTVVSQLPLLSCHCACWQWVCLRTNRAWFPCQLNNFAYIRKYLQQIYLIYLIINVFLWGIITSVPQFFYAIRQVLLVPTIIQRRGDTLLSQRVRTTFTLDFFEDGKTILGYKLSPFCCHNSPYLIDLSCIANYVQSFFGGGKTMETKHARSVIPIIFSIKFPLFSIIEVILFL